VRLLSTSTSLQMLSWSRTYNVPEAVLQSVEQSCPRTRLAVYTEMYPSLTRRQDEYTGFSSPCLHSLACLMPYEPSAQRAVNYAYLRFSGHLRIFVNPLLINNDPVVHFTATTPITKRSLTFVQKTSCHNLKTCHFHCSQCKT
jgi:hypothetical protein